MYDSVEVSTKDDSEAGELWRSGTTPLMTAFFSYNGDADFAPILEPEVHLTCLRTVPSKKQNGAAGIGILVPASFAARSLAVTLAMVVLLVCF